MSSLPQRAQLKCRFAAAAALISLPRPELSPENTLAIAAWNFCGGWFPERIDLYEALHGIDNMAELIELMAVISDHVNSPKDD